MPAFEHVKHRKRQRKKVQIGRMLPEFSFTFYANCSAQADTHTHTKSFKRMSFTSDKRVKEQANGAFAMLKHQQRQRNSNNRRVNEPAPKEEEEEHIAIIFS